MTIISGTSILSNYFLIQEPDIIRLTFGRVLIPKKVFDELLMLRHFGRDIESLINSEWIEVREVRNMERYSTLSRTLDPGEAEAILLAEELNADFLLIDDLKGRKYAEKLGLVVVGSVGILIRAKEKGIINEVKPYLDKLIEVAGAWISPALYRSAINQAKENS
jgi:uncharacterized protein